MCQKTIHSILLLFCIFSVIFAEIVRIPGLNNSKARAFSLRFGKRSHIDPSWITSLRLGRMLPALTTHSYMLPSLSRNAFFVDYGERLAKREDTDKRAMKNIRSSKTLQYLRFGRSV